MNAMMNNTTPMSANTTAATMFDNRLSKAVVMSFPPAHAGTDVGVMRAIRPRIGAHGARYIPDFRHADRRPAAPLRRGDTADREESHHEIDVVSEHCTRLVNDPTLPVA